MKRQRCFTAGLLLFSFLALIPIAPGAAAAPPDKGESFPAITFPIPKDADDKNYLGLSGSGSFKITQIKAQAVLIEIFSMYCPYCQKDAPGVNELFQAIENDPELKGRIKIIGLGAGNSAYEVGVYKKTYNVPFPLIPDERFALHKALGETRTPYFLLVRVDQRGTGLVTYSELAGFKGVESFLEVLRKSAGIN
jgi:thiol-disulfide isomerase/thioredoxin